MSDFTTNNITQNQQKSSTSSVVNANNNIVEKDTVARRFGFNLSKIKYIEENPIWFDFVIEGGLNILAGPPSSGKTLLMYYLVADLLKAGKSVVYIDLDNPLDVPKRRGLVDKVENLIEQDESIQENFVYLNISDYIQAVKENKVMNKMLFLRNVFAKLEGLEKNTFVFVDSLQNFVKKTTDETEMGDFINYLKDIATKGVTIIVLHHFARIAGHIKGDSRVIDLPDSVYTVKKKNEEINEIRSIELKAEKQKYQEMAKTVVVSFGEDFEFDIATDISEKERQILVIMRNIFNRVTEIQQKELKERIKKAVRIGNNNLHIILQKFTQKGILNARTAGKKLFYSFNDIQDNNQTIETVKDNDNGNSKALSETTKTTINNGNNGNGDNGKTFINNVKENDTGQAEQTDIGLVDDLVNTQIEYHL